MNNLSAVHTLVINSLDDQIAVIDRMGNIIDVNYSWTRFGAENGLSRGYSCLGANYLQVLSASAVSGDDLAGEAANGIFDVVNGNRDSFYFEYPCHSPNEKRWFILRINCLKDAPQGLFVISHQNITRRKLAEERAEHLAMHDPLTGLANRRHFNLFLNREIRRSIRNQSAISLIEIDVDHFKDYNDTLGHLAGDQCLISVGKVLHGFSRRPDDLAARLGGDEFALVLGDTDVAEARKIAEAILKAVNDLKMVFNESGHISVSVGTASAIHHRQMSEDFLLQEADNALYRAKSAGRNRAVHAADEQT
ncbi:MAG: GGDEF domain-containing protein [Candidatus Accumulibacter sp. UW20]|jgi:diguanylate cyclase (GGDEF)-like protein